MPEKSYRITDAQRQALIQDIMEVSAILNVVGKDVALPSSLARGQALITSLSQLGDIDYSESNMKNLARHRSDLTAFVKANKNHPLVQDASSQMAFNRLIIGIKLVVPPELSGEKTV